MHTRTRVSAFSLIEIVLALGIISFALIAILGMFPVALDSALDSQRETQAALIAQRIFSDLGSQRPFIQKDGSSLSNMTPVDLTKASTYEIDYDEGGMLPGSPTEGVAITLGRPVYHATITISPDTTLTGLTGKLASAEIAIRTPVEASVKNARRYVFSTLLNSDPKALTATP